MQLTKNVLAIVLAALACTFAFSRALAAAPQGETYFTKANIWYEDPEDPIAVNYHKGAMIPAGTKVKIDLFRGNKIKFTTESNVTLVYLNVSKYSTISLQELFDRYFAKENPAAWLGGFFGKFNAQENEHIKNGTIAAGMSREAVLMAYGYPPSHRTPDLKSDTWVYWDSRFVNFKVLFQNNRVASIERGVHHTEEDAKAK